METMTQPDEIPSQADDADIEGQAREIIAAARDQPEGVVVYFRKAQQANRVVECINERYGGAQGHKIRIELYH
jgi:NMD protein affecting ribosome stability and mRNA decay